MMIDMDQPVLDGDAVGYPDWVFAAQAVNVGVEGVFVRGSSETSQNVTGIVDDVE